MIVTNGDPVLIGGELARRDSSDALEGASNRVGKSPSALGNQGDANIRSVRQ